MVHVVGMADIKISRDPGDKLITYALGSCLGISIHDQTVGVGGLLHVMLPTSIIDQAKKNDNPLMFVDTAVPILFYECYKLGADKSRLTVKVAGGASISIDHEYDCFRIGERNFAMLQKVLEKNNVFLKSYDVGLNVSRMMLLDIATGKVEVKANGAVTIL